MLTIDPPSPASIIRRPDHLVPLARIHRQQRRGRIDPGVVDQHRGRAELVRAAAEQVLDLIGIGDVRFENDASNTSSFHLLCRSRGAFAARPVVDSDVRAGLSEAPGHRRADGAAGSGHQGHTAPQIEEVSDRGNVHAFLEHKGSTDRVQRVRIIIGRTASRMKPPT
jgi:hypothetical protein